VQADGERKRGAGETVAEQPTDRERAGLHEIDAAMELIAADFRTRKLVEVANKGGQFEICVIGQFGQPVEDWGRAVGLGGSGAHRLRSLG
jgi:hypothetical protein